MKPFYLVLMVAMNLLWAGTYSIFKVLGQHLSSGSIATLRYAIAAATLAAAWAWLPGRGPRGKELVRVTVMGILVFCVAPRLQVEGVHRGHAGDTSLLMALDPLITALAAALFLHERIAPRRWWGFAFGMTGVILLSQIWRGAAPLEGLWPNLLFIASFVCESIYSIVGKPLLGRVGTLKLVGAGLAAGTGANVLLDILAGAPTLSAARALPWAGWMWLLYLALVCTVFGYTLWYVVIRETEVNVTGLTIFVQPVAGLALSVLWLKEPLHWGQLWGSLVIIAGLILGLRRNGAPAFTQAPASCPIAAGEGAGRLP